MILTFLADKFTTNLRELHVYWDDWKTYLRQDIIFRTEQSPRLLCCCWRHYVAWKDMSRNCWSSALRNDSLNLLYHDRRNWLFCWTDICFSKGFSTEARQRENNYCNNGKMGKGKSHVNIKKSYEKKTNRRARFTPFYRNSAKSNRHL